MKTTTINRELFFDAVRAKLFGGTLKSAQFEGLTVIIDYYLSHYTDLHWLAYVLATAYHETAKTMQPIDEHGTDKYFFEMYDMNGKRPKVAKDLGNSFPGDGVRYHGQGYVQLTGRANYATMGKLFGVDLVKNPTLAKLPSLAAKVLVEGMTRGMFTGRKLADYFIGAKEDALNARRIINGVDCNVVIAGYYRHFLAALHPTL